VQKWEEKSGGHLSSSDYDTTNEEDKTSNIQRQKRRNKEKRNLPGLEDHGH